MAKRMTVVISQGQSPHPAKRALEEDLVTQLLLEPGVEVMVVPHLYDMQPDGTGFLALKGVSGPLIVLAWLFDRAAHWTLDRHDIRGQAGVTLLRSAEDDGNDEDEESQPENDSATATGTAGDNAKERVLDSRPAPQRRIYCLDLRSHTQAAPYLAEIRRIVAENATKVVDLMGWASSPPAASDQRREADSRIEASRSGRTPLEPTAAESQGTVVRVAEDTGRRWYPVIDYSRCTNCMECIDFCLFGVYGIDRQETILVEQPDNCRKGCPACSRVCPENAIIFPQHKSPAIAGAEGLAGGLKIDLSALFGAPDGTANAIEVAARERDEQLMLAGRQAVGMTVGMPKRQATASAGQPDELDNLIDRLDDLDL